MKKSIVLAAVACFFVSTAFLGVGCAAKKNKINKDDMIHLTLKSGPQNAGAIGRAVFIPMGSSCQVNLSFGGVSRLISRPLRVYTFIYPGSCENPGEKPAYELNDTKITNKKEGDVWEVSKRIPVPLSTLVEGEYAIVIRSVPSDGNRELFCGDIR